MFKTYLLPLAAALLITPACLAPAGATPPVANGLTAAAPAADAQPVYYRGGHGPVGHGPVGRGPYVHGPVVRGPVGRGVYHPGGRYYGGTWYGTGRHFYGGRWYPYGVGSCWLASPIGFVWVCG